ncbi:MAG: MEKHLA domain-containing protein, partial [Planctomycetales bacterium]
MQPWQNENWIEQTQILLKSYRRFLGEELIARDGTVEEQSKALFDTDFVVVSHGTQNDPILNYGNETALTL